MSECQFIAMPISLNDVSIRGLRRGLGNRIEEIRYKSLFNESYDTEKMGEAVFPNLRYNPETNTYDVWCDQDENVIFTFTIDEIDERTED